MELQVGLEPESRYPLLMDSELVQKRWPTVANPNDLPIAGGQIADAVQELEACWRKGTLSACLSREDTRTLVGISLVEAYERLSFAPDEGICRCRADWVDNALEEFKGAWKPPVLAFVSDRADESGNHVVQHQGGEVAMRSDQIVAVRFWGVGIDLNGVERSVDVANFMLRRALCRLAGDISCLGRVCRAYVNGRFHPESVRKSCQGKGILFEHLIADVLNEDDFRAIQAPLAEDLFEWTDLRVRYPDLDRKNGARVQVKLIGREALHAQRMSRCRHPEGYVVVSPLQLASHVESFFESDLGGEVEAGFWECLGAEPVDRPELATALLRIFDSAILEPVRHPLGPMVKVPVPIRCLVRSYVKAKSFDAAKHMREELSGRPGLFPPWRSHLSTR
jgi:hypothetical protein